MERSEFEAWIEIVKRCELLARKGWLVATPRIAMRQKCLLSDKGCLYYCKGYCLYPNYCPVKNTYPWDNVPFKLICVRTVPLFI